MTTIRIQDVLIEPVVTEKTEAMVGKYTFRVHNKATKEDVKSAIKHFYNIDVEKVNITKVKPKSRLFGRGKVMVKRSGGKKAVVTLKEGQTLNFNDFK